VPAAQPPVPAAQPPAAPPAEEPPTKVRVEPGAQPELDFEPAAQPELPSGNVIPMRQPKQKQLKLPLPKPQAAPPADQSAGIRRIAEIEKKLIMTKKLWESQGKL